MNSNIEKTKDHSIFRPHPLNRQIDHKNVERLIKSIGAKNLLHSVPILVDAKMRVIDGNHRLEAAKRLELEVYYQVIEDADAEDMILLNSAQKKWSREDFVNFYACQGNKACLKTIEWSRKYGVSVGTISKFAAVANTRNTSKTGGFSPVNDFSPERSEEIERRLSLASNARDILLQAPMAGIVRDRLKKSWRLMEALWDLAQQENFDLAALEKRIFSRSEFLKIPGSCESATEMVKAIYNFRNNNPLI